MLRSLFLLLFLLLNLPALADNDDWVRNGQWSARLVKVEYVKNDSQFQGLPWASDFKGEIKEKTFAHVKNSVFAKEKQVALITFELKNTSSSTVKVGSNRGKLWSKIITKR